jgi:hypothetical protein
MHRHAQEKQKAEHRLVAHVADEVVDGPGGVLFKSGAEGVAGVSGDALLDGSALEPAQGEICKGLLGCFASARTHKRR